MKSANLIFFRRHGLTSSWRQLYTPTTFFRIQNCGPRSIWKPRNVWRTFGSDAGSGLASRKRSTVRHRLDIRPRGQRCQSQVATTHTESSSTPGVGQGPPQHTITSEPCTIKVLDYSDKQLVQHEVAGTKEELDSFLRDNAKPDWAACRWIWINGIDQGVVKSLGQHKGLHRLAIEDVLERSAPTKVDWYVEGYKA